MEDYEKLLENQRDLGIEFDLDRIEELIETIIKEEEENTKMEGMIEVKKNLIKLVGVNGKIFTVNFIKKDDSERVMNCRLNVKSNDKTVTDVVHGFPQYIRVYDVVARGYRTINLDTVKRVAGAGQEINFK